MLDNFWRAGYLFNLWNSWNGWNSIFLILVHVHARTSLCILLFLLFHHHSFNRRFMVSISSLFR